jgi:hypothetical protein
VSELLKSINERIEEVLEKGAHGKRYGFAKPIFSHGSTIKINKAITHPKTGKTHGYHVTETKADGSTVDHENIPFRHLDQASEGSDYRAEQDGRGKARLRMTGETIKPGHDHHHEAKVHISEERRNNGTSYYHMALHPHNEPHTSRPHEEKVIKSEQIQYLDNGQWVMLEKSNTDKAISEAIDRFDDQVPEDFGNPGGKISGVPKEKRKAKYGGPGKEKLKTKPVKPKEVSRFHPDHPHYEEHMEAIGYPPPKKD